MPKNRKFYNIVAKSSNEVDIFIYGPVGYGTWYEESRDAFEFVTEFKNLEKKYERINIRINSAGGIIEEGLPIFNVINQSKKETHSYIDGIAYSMAAIIALAANTVHSARNGLFLLHNASGWAFGNAKELRDTSDELDQYDASLITSLIDKTGLTENEVKEKWFDYEDHLITAQEAKDAGLIDEIEEKDADLPDDIKNMNMKQVMNYLSTLNNSSDEEKFIDKVINKLKNTFNQSTNSQIKNTDKMNKEQLQKVANSIGLPDDATFDEVLAKINEINIAKTKAESDLTVEKTAKETSENTVTEITNALNELGEIVKNAEKPAEKIEAVRTLLAEKPGTDTSKAQVKEDKIDDDKSGADWETINNLPHNTEVDSNTL